MLGEYATRPEHLHEFGLVSSIAAQALGARASLPQVQSIRTARRVGPDGQIIFDLVAEITQELEMRPPDRSASYQLVGGSTVILGPDGEIRYVISKSALGCDRVQRRRAFMDSPQGQQFWHVDDGRYVEKAPLFAMLHAH